MQCTFFFTHGFKFCIHIIVSKIETDFIGAPVNLLQYSLQQKQLNYCTVEIVQGKTHYRLNQNSIKQPAQSPGYANYYRITGSVAWKI